MFVQVGVVVDVEPGRAKVLDELRLFQLVNNLDTKAEVVWTRHRCSPAFGSSAQQGRHSPRCLTLAVTFWRAAEDVTKFGESEQHAKSWLQVATTWMSAARRFASTLEA